MNKREFVHSLNKVKLVIGNGFDLHCHLHTTYSDFYCKYFQKFLFIQNTFSEYEKTNTLSFDFADKRVNQLNSWDIFFALNSSFNPKECKKRWCDIERLILSSLQPYDQEAPGIENLIVSLLSEINWRNINHLIYSNLTPTNHTDRFMVSFIKEKMNYLNCKQYNFYQFLLNELKEFEKTFGEFIYYQLHDEYLELINYGQSFFNEAYIEMAKDTIEELCNIDNLVGIDSFNYSYIHTEGMMKLLQHINGSFENPIFGVDTVFEPNDECFIFTKTARRMDADMFDDSTEEKPSFDNLIVFGHSLDEADYSYFFPAFDRLHLLDSLASNVVVFAFSIFDKEKETEIKANIRQSVSDIMYSYAKSKNLSDPNRFLDSLSTQNRVILYEIPQLRRRNYSTCFLDQKWIDIYKHVDAETNKEKRD